MTLRALLSFRPLLALTLVAGCRGTTPAADPDRVAITELVADVVYLRRLERKEPIVVHLVDQKTFDTAMARERVLDDRSRERERAWLTAFSLAPADVDLGGAADAQSSAISAVYDASTKRVMVPRGAKLDQESLAHEVAHALVDQHFSMRFVSGGDPASDEEAAAYLAFLEGDAAATQAIYATRKYLAGPSAMLGRIAANRGDSESELVAADGPYSHLANWIPTYRDEVLLRYSHALRFVAALHRIGGFALVDRAWSKPPTTTEQILHPEKYLAGEGAIPVTAPTLPAGMASVLTSSAGEMGIRSILSMCVDEQIAHAAAAGWGGDAYRVVRHTDGTLALLWATAWDDEAGAIRFADAMTTVMPCWDSALVRDASSTHPHLASGTTVVRDGERVAVLRGISADTKVVLAGVGTKATPSPPLGALTVFPFPDGEPPVPHGGFVGRRFELPELGLAVTIPPEMTAEKSIGAGVVMRGPEDKAYVEVVVLDRSYRDVIVTKFLDNLSNHGALSVVDAGRGMVGTPIGNADERRFLMGAVTIRILFVPICGGLRTVATIAWWAGEQNAALFDGAVQGLARMGAEPPAACH